MLRLKMVHLLVALAPLVIAGCASTEDQRAADQNKCTSYGYEPESDAFADCMMAQDRQRANDQRRTMNSLERQDRLDRERAEANRRDGQDMLYRRQNNSIDSTPQFDKDGNPNFDTQGNYQGCHGVGCLVDNPDAN